MSNIVPLRAQEERADFISARQQDVDNYNAHIEATKLEVAIVAQRVRDETEKLEGLKLNLRRQIDLRNDMEQRLIEMQSEV